ncbi:MAG: cephalosporin hydroxylase [Candidatus Abyssobacteria bacterium SURF_5]|uniref:Cephalosporin hydroxylase n=1 Tax=Abyssobacteria bacterium (strain SURF_5) TaxID=2093360 RepID=A0A3A4P5E5_ABYX5|nr:MAG: cephalosporin hydroxylase [Candidatus Abyssubacteria bacterium SURF_5]
MDIIEQFQKERKENIERLGKSQYLKQMGIDFIIKTAKYKYSYNFTWLGRPIIQFPQDILAMQEIIWEVKPDLIIETGIAHGGSIVLSASMLELIGKGEVLGIDIDIRPHNRKAIEEHPLYKRITLLEGSSIASEILSKVENFAKMRDKILVFLDSSHTYDHVLAELRTYSKFVSIGSYLVVFDTVIEDMPEELFSGKPWKKGNNPKIAVRDFLKMTDAFVEVDDIPNKLLITVAPGGYLKRVR